VQSELHHHFAAGLYAKEYFLPKGWAVPQHVHSYSHLSILAKGEVVVDIDGEHKFYKAPACIEIEANKSHVIITQTDTVWYCVHATEQAEMESGEIVPNKEAYGWLGRSGSDAGVADTARIK
jgi:quercetin dioxygenase-like cupin family protein